ncbi:MAG: precorrin-2 C(20)-methyltransferase [Oscillospiraceae bacterium]|nr:precorrin-2 C(20)-methyltransferase [Oscillospiraceae bacterium]
MGILYGISTGPGDPELMTVRAVRILERCTVIAAPQKPGTESLALRIAGGTVNLRKKQVLALDFPMTKDAAVLAAAEQKAAAALCEVLRTADAAFLCLGDISLYATYSPVAALVREAGFEVVQIPGVMSFSAAAALAGKALVTGDTPLQVLPFGCEGLAERLRLPGAKVILKCGAHLPELVRLLEETGQLSHAYAVENCGLPEERLFPVVQPERCGYFTTVIVPAKEDADVSL